MALVSLSEVKRRRMLRLAVVAAAAAMAAIVSAVAIRYADSYLVAHGHAGLRKEMFSSAWLSAGDIILLVMTLLAGAAGWILSASRR